MAGVDLARARLLWVAPVLDAPLPEAGDDGTEGGVVDQERVVLTAELDVGLGEVEDPTVGQLHLEEDGPTGIGAGRPKIFAKNVAEDSASTAGMRVWSKRTSGAAGVSWVVR